MQYYHNNKQVKFFGVQKQGCGKPDIAKIQHMAPGAMIVSVPFSELTTDATVDEYIKADREFYVYMRHPFFTVGGQPVPFEELSALARQTIRQSRLEAETKKAQLTEKKNLEPSVDVYGYSPTFNKLCQELIDLLFPEGERDGVGNIDTILEKAKAEMAQLTEYRRANEAFMSNKDMDQSFANPLSDKVYEDGSARTPARIDFLKDLDLITQQVFDMLSEKNLKYGDSALNPSGIFAKCDPIELINVRIDDKLARIKNNLTDDDEDPEWDLIGYLFLKRIAKMRQGRNNV